MVIQKDKLKFKIVENNSEVLPIFLRDIGENLKPGEDVALVRFDSYADFLVPNDVQADEMENVDNLADSISNHCWILPAVYRGFIKRIFWFKPPWAHQFQDGVYQIQVGKCPQTGLLKVASTNPYFTANCIYTASDKLLDVKTVDIYICTAGLAKNYSTIIEKSHEPIYDDDSSQDNHDNDQRKKAKLSSIDVNHSEATMNKRIHPLDATLINKLLENKSFFVDVDLSFFSTDDPVRKQFDENEYEILRYVYTRIVHEHSEGEIMQYITVRENALEQIRVYMNEYVTGSKSDQPVLVENLYIAALISIIRYKKLDWKSIHHYGMHLTDTRPPLHVSSEGMIIYLIESMARILESIKKQPILITLSRCVEDGFCSVEQSDLIQTYVEKRFTKLYKIDEFIGKRLSKSLNNDDDEDEFDDNTRNDENLHRMKTDEKKISSSIDSNKNLSLKTETNLGLSSSINRNNHRTPSPSKTNLSPGEVKAMSPSSLSDGSPVSS